MPKDEPQDLTPEQALERAQRALDTGPLAQMGITIQTPEEIQVRMATRLLNATSVDDLLDGSGTAGWGDHEGRSVLVRSVAYAPSTKRSRIGFYAVVEAEDVETGESLLLTTGSENVVMQLVKLVQLEGIEVPVKLVSNTTGDGNIVHRLVKGDVGNRPAF